MTPILETCPADDQAVRTGTALLAIPMAARAVVCQVLHSLTVGGAEQLAARIARRLSDRFEFVFACLDELGTLGEQLRQEGFEVHVIGRKQGFDWNCARRLGRFMRSARASIAHAHQYTPFCYASLSRGVNRGPAVIFTEHGRHFPDFPRKKRKLANRVLLRRGDQVTAVGESVRQALIHNEGLPANRIRLLYNGIDLSQGAFDPLVRDAVRYELGVAADEFVVLQVARLDRLKDHKTAVRAFKRVVERRPRARLILAGEGPERAAIEQEIEDQRLEDRVQMLGLRRDIPRLLAAADCFLLTSISEGIPLTIIEALAADVPVVSTNVGGIPEIFQDNVQGLLAPSGDPAALADRVLSLVVDPELRKRIATAGHTRVSELFDEQTMLLNYERLYRELCPIHRAG